MKISGLSLEYIAVEVTDVIGGDDPTGSAVAFAFVATGEEPVADDFEPGTWETANGKYYAQALVGPSGTHVLAVGAWDMWIKLTVTPEVPVRRVGRLTIE